MTTQVPLALRVGGDRPLSEPTVTERRQVFVLGALILATAVTTALAGFSNPPADEWAYRLVRGSGGLDSALGWADATVTGPALAGLIGIVGLAAIVVIGRRCRTFVLVSIGTLVLGGVLGLALPVLTSRAGPVDSPTPDTASYPSIGVLVLTLLAGLVPMSLRSRACNLLIRRLASALLAVLVLAVAVTEVHAGVRWPLDVVGAVLIGSALVTVARILLESSQRHPWCQRCPWLQEAAGARAASPVVMRIDERRARWLHRLTLVWVAGLVATYVVLAWTVGMPRTPESGVMGSGLEVPLQWSALALLVVGVLVARRRHLAGTMIVGFVACVLASASSVEYPPWVGLLVLVGTGGPAALLWLEWHRRTTLRAALVAAVATSVVLAGVVGASATTYSAFWGPTHPRSATAAPASDVVEWMWTGGVTPTTAVVRLRTAEPARSIRVVVSQDTDLARPVTTARARVDDDRVAAATLDGLAPGTLYHYGAEVDGTLVTERIQSFRTFPQGAANFSFAFGSCQLGGSNGRVHDAIRALDPLFMMSTGDWHYGNVDVNDVNRFRAQYELNLTAPAQAALYAQTPVAYVWDDHDFGPNNANRGSPSRAAAMQVYRQMVPHYPLAGPNSALYQAFTVGRVRFVLMDTRAARDPVGNPSGSYRSTLGAEQRAWLLGELADADRYGLVVLVSPDPWVAKASPTSDNWGGFAQERRVIADAIAANGVDNLLMVAGDAHMLAYDDGTNTDYSTSGVGGFPLFHAAALDRPANVKGGPYSGPVLPGGGQFGQVEVRDDGTNVEVTLTGWRWDATRLFTKELSFPGQK